MKNRDEGKRRKEIDYWSVGILIFEVLNKKCPFTFGPYIGSDIIENWLNGNHTSFNTYYNRSKRHGILMIEQIVLITGVNCL